MREVAMRVCCTGLFLFVGFFILGWCCGLSGEISQEQEDEIERA